MVDRDDPLLMIPGPVSIGPEIQDAICGDLISHRSETFEAVYRDCQRDLRSVFGTDKDLAFVNGSGTAAMEAAVSNVVSDADTVLCIQNGKFGRRFETIAKRYSSEVRSVSFEWGQPLDLEAVRAEFDTDVSVVTVVHADTSAGLVNPVDRVGKLAAEYDALSIVDCVTSAGSEEIRLDEWGIDMAVTASQKAIGAPPGVSAVVASENARRSFTSESTPFYLDLTEHFSRAKTHQTPTTSNVHAFLGLQKALQQLIDEGIQSRIDRLERYSKAIREAGSAMGLPPYPTTNENSTFTNAIAMLEVPNELNANTLVRRIEEQGILVRSGLGDLSDTTIRIGTMGAIDSNDILRVIETLQNTLKDTSFEPVDNGVPRAKAILE